MGRLTVKDIPEEVVKKLKQAAAEEHRSVNCQAIHWLEQSARRWMSFEDRTGLIRRIESLRKTIAQRHGPASDSTKIIRRMRMERVKRLSGGGD